MTKNAGTTANLQSWCLLACGLRTHPEAVSRRLQQAVKATQQYVQGVQTTCFALRVLQIGYHILVVLTVRSPAPILAVVGSISLKDALRSLQRPAYQPETRHPSLSMNITTHNVPHADFIVGPAGQCRLTSRMYAVDRGCGGQAHLLANKA